MKVIVETKANSFFPVTVICDENGKILSAQTYSAEEGEKVYPINRVDMEEVKSLFPAAKIAAEKKEAAKAAKEEKSRAFFEDARLQSRIEEIISQSCPKEVYEDDARWRKMIIEELCAVWGVIVPDNFTF